MTLKYSIRSGGQSGVDRAALDTARKFGFPTHGWCPLGGWAEDYPEPPGLLIDYPELQEAPSADVNVRTEWNVRDADITLIFSKVAVSEGTIFTQEMCNKYSRPYILIGSMDGKAIFDALADHPHCTDINIAGPRESERPGVYNRASATISSLLELLIRNTASRTSSLNIS